MLLITFFPDSEESTDTFEECGRLVSEDTSSNMDPQKTVDEPEINKSEPVCPLILHGDPLTDRKSTFQAHVAQVYTTDQVN